MMSLGTLGHRLQRVMLLAMVLAMLSTTSIQFAANAADSRKAIVGSDRELSDALANSSGVTEIKLRSGRYGDLIIAKRSAPISIESIDPLHPASLTGVTIGGAHDVTLKNLAVERRVGEPLRAQLVMIRRSGKVVLDSMRIAASAEVDGGREYGVMIRDSEDIGIGGSRIGGMRYGIGMLNSRRIQIRDNEFRDLQTDGVRGGGVDDLVIANNVFGRFRPKPREHPDGIQLWSTNQKTPAKRIAIRNNLIVRDGGGITQGIFVRDTERQLPFEGLDIRGNMTIGTMYNGIAILGAVSAIVSDNDVIAFPDQKAWIRLQGVNGGELIKNRAPQFVQSENSGISASGNQTTLPSADQLASRIRQWLETHPDMAARAGPYLRELTGQGNAPKFTTH
jgi:hypothetical protein